LGGEAGVSDFDSLREDIGAVAESFEGYIAAQRRQNDVLLRDGVKRWEEIAELRDDLHAVANRLEALTAFVTSNPAEVAAKIVNDANRATLREVKGDE
jgi:hypothetical protein